MHCHPLVCFLLILPLVFLLILAICSQFDSSYSILWRPRPAAKSADAANCEVEVEVGVEIELVESRNSIDPQ